MVTAILIYVDISIFDSERFFLICSKCCTKKILVLLIVFLVKEFFKLLNRLLCVRKTTLKNGENNKFTVFTPTLYVAKLLEIFI